MTGATGVTTASTAIGMTIRAGLAAIVLVMLLNRFARINNTETGFTGTFHLRNGRHGSSPNWVRCH